MHVEGISRDAGDQPIPVGGHLKRKKKIESV